MYSIWITCVLLFALPHLISCQLQGWKLPGSDTCNALNKVLKTGATKSEVENFIGTKEKIKLAEFSYRANDDSQGIAILKASKRFHVFPMDDVKNKIFGRWKFKHDEALSKKSYNTIEEAENAALEISHNKVKWPISENGKDLTYVDKTKGSVGSGIFL